MTRQPGTGGSPSADGDDGVVLGSEDEAVEPADVLVLRFPTLFGELVERLPWVGQSAPAHPDLLEARFAEQEVEIGGVDGPGVGGINEERVGKDVQRLRVNRLDHDP